MILRYLSGMAITVSMFISSAALAHDFTAADDLFQARQAGPAKIQQALDAYSTAQRDGGLSDVEAVYAAEQKGRLYMYWGYIVDQSNTNLRVRIANDCKTALEAIKPTRKQFASPQYYYWKGACTMAWANARGIMASLSESQNVLNALSAGKELDPAYEGGGFDRLSGVLFSKLPGWNPLGPNGDMPRALQHFRRWLDADVYDDPMFPEWKDPDTETGEYHYSGYVYYAEALKKDRQIDEARQLAEDALERLADEDFPVGREPEAGVAKARLQTFLRTL